MKSVRRYDAIMAAINAGTPDEEIMAAWEDLGEDTMAVYHKVVDGTLTDFQKDNPRAFGGLPARDFIKNIVHADHSGVKRTSIPRARRGKHIEDEWQYLGWLNDQEG